VKKELGRADAEDAADDESAGPGFSQSTIGSVDSYDDLKQLVMEIIDSDDAIDLAKEEVEIAKEDLVTANRSRGKGIVESIAQHYNVAYISDFSTIVYPLR